MWSLESIKQINQKHAELAKEGKSVNARQVYSECGIRVLGDSYKGDGNVVEFQAGQDQELRNGDSQGR